MTVQVPSIIRMSLFGGLWRRKRLLMEDVIRNSGKPLCRMGTDVTGLSTLFDGEWLSHPGNIGLLHPKILLFHVVPLNMSPRINVSNLYSIPMYILRLLRPERHTLKWCNETYCIFCSRTLGPLVHAWGTVLKSTHTYTCGCSYVDSLSYSGTRMMIVYYIVRPETQGKWVLTVICMYMGTNLKVKQKSQEPTNVK